MKRLTLFLVCLFLLSATVCHAGRTQISKSLTDDIKQLAGNVITSYSIHYTKLYEYGYCYACFISLFAAYWILDWNIRNLEYITFARQPIG